MAPEKTKSSKILDNFNYWILRPNAPSRSKKNRKCKVWLCPNPKIKPSKPQTHNQNQQ
jgi:hypothetical protein